MGPSKITIAITVGKATLSMFGLERGGVYCYRQRERQNGEHTHIERERELCTGIAVPVSLYHVFRREWGCVPTFFPPNGSGVPRLLVRERELHTARRSGDEGAKDLSR